MAEILLFLFLINFLKTGNTKEYYKQVQKGAYRKHISFLSLSIQPTRVHLRVDH